jgi:hypothetical protein
MIASIVLASTPMLTLRSRVSRSNKIRPVIKAVQSARRSGQHYKRAAWSAELAEMANRPSSQSRIDSWKTTAFGPFTATCTPLSFCRIVT